MTVTEADIWIPIALTSRRDILAAPPSYRRLSRPQLPKMRGTGSLGFLPS